MLFDIDLIPYNASLFNEDTSLVISYAKQVAEALKILVQNYSLPNVLDTIKVSTKNKRTAKNNH